MEQKVVDAHHVQRHRYEKSKWTASLNLPLHVVMANVDSPPLNPHSHSTLLFWVTKAPILINGSLAALLCLTCRHTILLLPAYLSLRKSSVCLQLILLFFIALFVWVSPPAGFLLDPLFTKEQPNDPFYTFYGCKRPLVGSHHNVLADTSLCYVMHKVVAQHWHTHQQLHHHGYRLTMEIKLLWVADKAGDDGWLGLV